MTHRWTPEEEEDAAILLAQAQSVVAELETKLKRAEVQLLVLQKLQRELLEHNKHLTNEMTELAPDRLSFWEREFLYKTEGTVDAYGQTLKDVT